MDNRQEGNLISFRVFLARDGNIISEYSHLPFEDIEKIFPTDEIPIIKKVVKEGSLKLEGLHNLLEKEVQSIIY